MSRKARKYLMVLLMCSLVYLMALAALRANEEKTRQEFITQSENVPVKGHWIVLGSVEGLLLGCSIWLYWKSSGGEKTWKEIAAKKNLSSAAGFAAGGLAGGLALSTLLAGNLPTIDLPLMGVVQQPVAKVDDDQKPADEQTETPSAPVAEPEDSADKQDASESEEYSFPVPELPPVLPESTFVSLIQGVQTIGDAQDLSGTFASDQSDTSAIVIDAGGQATLLASVLTKAGDTTNMEATLEAGLNSALFVKKGGSASLLSVNIQTRANGAPAAAVNGKDASMSAADSILTTYADNSSGLDVLHQGSASLNNVHVFTYGNASPALKAAGSASISAQNAIASTAGANAYIIEAAAALDLNNVNGSAQTASIAKLENGASLNLSSAAFTCGGATEEDADGSAFVFTSNTGSKKSQRTTLSLANCQLGFGMQALPGSWMFSLNNAKADLQVTLSSLQTLSNHLMKAMGSDVNLRMDSQTQSGNIMADTNSTVHVELTQNTVWNGSLNTENTGAHASIKMDASSTLSLMQDCYLESFEDEDSSYSNVSFNGFMIYVNGQPLIVQ